MNVYAMGMKFLMLKCGIVKLMLAFCVLHMKLVIGGVIRQNLGINLSPDRFCFLSMDELVLEQNMQQIIPSAQRIGVGRLLNHKIRTCSVCPDSALWGVGYMINVLEYQNLIEHAAMKLSPVFISEVLVEFEDTKVTCKTTNIELPINLVYDVETSQYQINSDISSISSGFKHSSHESTLYTEDNLILEKSKLDKPKNIAAQPQASLHYSNIPSIHKSGNEISFTRKPKPLQSLKMKPKGGVYTKEYLPQYSNLQDSLPPSTVVPVATRKKPLKSLNRLQRIGILYSNVFPRGLSNTDTRELQHSSHESTLYTGDNLILKKSKLDKPKNIALQPQAPLDYSNIPSIHKSGNDISFTRKPKPLQSLKMKPKVGVYSEEYVPQYSNLQDSLPPSTVVPVATRKKPLKSLNRLQRIGILYSNVIPRGLSNTDTRELQHSSHESTLYTGDNLILKKSKLDKPKNIALQPQAPLDYSNIPSIHKSGNDISFTRKPKPLQSLKMKPKVGVYSEEYVPQYSNLQDSLPPSTVVPVATRKKPLKSLNRLQRIGILYSNVIPRGLSNTDTRELQHSSHESTLYTGDNLILKKSKLDKPRNIALQPQAPLDYSNIPSIHKSGNDISFTRKPKPHQSLKMKQKGGVYLKEYVPQYSNLEVSLPPSTVVPVATRKNPLKSLNRLQRIGIPYSNVIPRGLSNTDTRELRHSSHESTLYTEDNLILEKSKLDQPKNIAGQPQASLDYSNIPSIHKSGNDISFTRKPKPLQSLKMKPKVGVYSEEYVPQYSNLQDSLPPSTVVPVATRKKPLKSLNRLQRIGILYSNVIPRGLSNTDTRELQHSSHESTLYTGDNLILKKSKLDQPKNIAGQPQASLDYSNIPSIHKSGNDISFTRKPKPLLSLKMKPKVGVYSEEYVPQYSNLQDSLPPSTVVPVATRKKPLKSLNRLQRIGILYSNVIPRGLSNTDTRELQHSSHESTLYTGDNLILKKSKLDKPKNIALQPQAPLDYSNIPSIHKSGNDISFTRKPKPLQSLKMKPKVGVYSKEYVPQYSNLQDSLPPSTVVPVATRKKPLKSLNRLQRIGILYSNVIPRGLSNTDTRELQHSSHESTLYTGDNLILKKSKLDKPRNIALQPQAPLDYSNIPSIHKSGNDISFTRKPKPLQSLKMKQKGGVYSKEYVPQYSNLEVSLPPSTVVPVATRKNPLKSLNRLQRIGIPYSNVIPRGLSNTDTRELRHSSHESTLYTEDNLILEKSKLDQPKNIAGQPQASLDYSNIPSIHKSGNDISFTRKPKPLQSLKMKPKVGVYSEEYVPQYSNLQDSLPPSTVVPVATRKKPLKSLNRLQRIGILYSNVIPRGLSNTDTRELQHSSHESTLYTGDNLILKKSKLDQPKNIAGQPQASLDYSNIPSIHKSGNDISFTRKPKPLQSLKMKPKVGVYSEEYVPQYSNLQDSLPPSTVVPVATRKKPLKSLNRLQRIGILYSNVIPRGLSNTDTRELQHSSHESTLYTGDNLILKKSKLDKPKNIALQPQAPLDYSNIPSIHKSGNDISFTRKPKPLQSLKMKPKVGVYSKEYVPQYSNLQDSLPPSTVVPVATRKKPLKSLNRLQRIGILYSNVIPRGLSNTDTRELQHSSHESTLYTGDNLILKKSKLDKPRNIALQPQAPLDYSNIPSIHKSGNDISFTRKPKPLQSLKMKQKGGVYSKEYVPQYSNLEVSLPPSTVVPVATRKNPLKSLNRLQRIGIPYSNVIPRGLSNTDTRELRHSSHESTLYTEDNLILEKSKLDQPKNIAGQPQASLEYSNIPSIHKSGNDISFTRKPKPLQSLKMKPKVGVYSEEYVPQYSNLQDSLPPSTVVPVATRKKPLKSLNRLQRIGIVYSNVIPRGLSNTDTRELRHSSHESSLYTGDNLILKKSKLDKPKNIALQPQAPLDYSNIPSIHKSGNDISFTRKPKPLQSLKMKPKGGVYSKEYVPQYSNLEVSLPPSTVVPVATRKKPLKSLNRLQRIGIPYSNVIPRGLSNTDTRELRHSSHESTLYTEDNLILEKSKLDKPKNIAAQPQASLDYSNIPSIPTSANDMKPLEPFNPLQRSRSHNINPNEFSNTFPSFPHSSDVITKRTSPMSSLSKKKFGKLYSYPNNSGLDELLMRTYSSEQFDKNNKLTSLYSNNNNQQGSNSAFENSSIPDLVSMSSNVSSRQIENINLDAKESTVQEKSIPTMPSITLDSITSDLPDIQFGRTNINNDPNSEILISENGRMSKKSYKSQHITRKDSSLKSHQEFTLTENSSLL